MDVHVFAASPPTTHNARRQASLLVTDANDAHAWFDVALPALTAEHLLPGDLSGLDEFAHPAGRTRGGPGVSPAGNACHSPSRHSSSLDGAAQQVSDATTSLAMFDARPASPGRGLPDNDPSLVLTPAAISSNQIPCNCDTPPGNQLHMHNRPQSAGHRHGGTPHSQRRDSSRPSQSSANISKDASGAQTSDASLPPLPPNQQQLYAAQHGDHATQDSSRSSLEIPVPRSNPLPNPSFSFISQGQGHSSSPHDATKVVSDTSRLDWTGNRTSSSQLLPHPSQHSFSFNYNRDSPLTYSDQLHSFEQAQPQSASVGNMSRDISNTSRSYPSYPPMPPNQLQLQRNRDDANNSQGSLYSARGADAQRPDPGSSLRHSSVAEHPSSQDSLYGPDGIPAPGRTQPLRHGDQSQGSQDSLFGFAADNTRSTHRLSSHGIHAHRSDPAPEDGDETPPGLFSSSSHAVDLMLSRSPVHGQEAPGDGSPPGLSFHGEPTFDPEPRRSFAFDEARQDAAMDVDAAPHPLSRPSDERYAGLALLNRDEHAIGQHASQSHSTQYETAPQAPADDVTPVQSQAHLTPQDWSPPSVHWPQILGRSHYSNVLQSSPLPSQAPASQIPGSQQPNARPYLSLQALLALSQAQPGAGGSQLQERSASPAPSAYLPKEAQRGRVAAHDAWGDRYDAAYERAYGRVQADSQAALADQWAEYNADGGHPAYAPAGEADPGDDARSRWTSSTQRMLSQSSGSAPRPSQESLPARVEQVLGALAGVVQPSGQPYPQPDAPPYDSAPHAQHPSQSSLSQALYGHLPTPAQSHPPAGPVAGPSRVADGASAVQQVHGPLPPEQDGDAPAVLSEQPEEHVAPKPKPKAPRKPRAPPFSFTPCPPPRDAPEPDPESAAERGRGRGRPDGAADRALPASSAPATVPGAVPLVSLPSLRMPRRPSATIVPDSQEERERHEREVEGEVMHMWEQLKAQRRRRVEGDEGVGWAIPEPHEWPVPARSVTVASSIPQNVSSPEPGASIMGSLPTDPERLWDGQQIKEYHDSQQCTQEDWPPTQPSEPQVDVGMDIDGAEDIFTNPDPLYYAFPDDVDAMDPPLPDPTPRDGKSKKRDAPPVPRPLAPYDRVAAESFLCSPYGRCTWIVPVRGCLGFGCSPASLLVPPEPRFAVTPYPVMPPPGNMLPPEPHADESWMEAYGEERLRGAMRALPQLLASGPATTSSFQDAPGELVWTVDALGGLWELLLLFPRARRVGLLGVRFVPRGAAASQGSQEDEHAAQVREALRDVDHIRVELDARYAMTVRYLLHVWRYECTMPGEFVALRRIRERLTGSDGNKEPRKQQEADSGKGKGKGKGKEREVDDVEMGDDTRDGRGMKRKRTESRAAVGTPREGGAARETRLSREDVGDASIAGAATPLGEAVQPRTRETREERMRRMNHSSKWLFRGARLLLLDERGRPVLTC
ncbi:hypothetical protein PsYK624_084550 [Phanerochaete sordida]|uniref:Uncharacterized protein n=1 Tax=Phanerochaete sordida TaxID=48140 RepID=A0A9P3GCD4_9APHY|nr:hypothetical protein PsYK624_084550 [Phanerochaete sordida]